MYDELVRRLRICPDYNDGCVNCQHEHDLGCRTTTMREAADAIEELSRENESLAKSVNEASEILRKRWIPVTEKPPLKVGDDGYNGYLVYANGYYEIADYVTEKFDNVPYFHVDGEYEPDVTHWMPLPQKPKGE